MDEKDLRIYAFLSRLPFPKSYLGKILLAVFLGTHVPLIALVLYFILTPPIGFGPMVGIFAVLILATVFGAASMLCVLYFLLKPVSLASKSLRDYHSHRKMPTLPTRFTDQAGRLMADIQSAIEHLDELLRALEERSVKDYLTGVYNRGAGEERLAGELARAERSGSVLTLSLIDIDQFKPINDRHGHEAGDRCLKHVVSILQRNIREGDWLARWGGDEFLMVLWNTEVEHPVQRTLDRIVEEVAENPVVLPGGEKLWVTLSGGVCRSTDGSETVTGVIARADQALYRAKQKGRNRFVYV